MSLVLKKTGRYRPDSGSLDALAERCASGLEALYSTVRSSTGGEPALVYRESVGYIIRLLAVLMASERINRSRSTYDAIQLAARSVTESVSNLDTAYQQVYEDACDKAREKSGLGIFGSSVNVEFNAQAFAVSAKALLCPGNDAPIEPIYFETLPFSWLGSIYQRLLVMKPDESGDRLDVSWSHRKGRGVFYTPPSLVSYIIEGVLTPVIESRVGLFTSDAENGGVIRVLDPAMGGGDFLTRAVEFIAQQTTNGMVTRGRIAAECVFGVDVDHMAVEIARFGVWAASGFSDGISDALNSHLVCGNALGARHADELKFDWEAAFPEAFDSGGFDAVVGNPPYIAAKNGLRSACVSGQSDSYLMFLSEIIDNKLVRSGGLFSMVLPDPMLVRENAAGIRRKLMTDWSIVSLLHIAGAFRDALVANIVPICRNAPPSIATFTATRIERSADLRSFMVRPRKTAVDLAHKVRLESISAQDRCEFLYLLEQGGFGEIIRRIHGDSAVLSNYMEPFVPLRKLNVNAIYRGEEVGKSAINSETGDQPMLLGGQSIQPYEIIWEGRRASISWVKKPLERYHSTKILIQKSSARIIAAMDMVSANHPGYVFPQSVYAVELAEGGIDPFYLLCILNSQVMNEYIRRTVTGYKLLQPQLELEDIRALPIRQVSFTTDTAEREIETARGISIFESESLSMGEFPELANFIAGCLTGETEKSDIAHDVLAHLGRLMVTLAHINRKSPDLEATSRFEATRAAIETIVWRLYSNEPEQMELLL